MLVSEAMLEDFQSRYHFLRCLGDEFGRQMLLKLMFSSKTEHFSIDKFSLDSLPAFCHSRVTCSRQFAGEMARRPFHFR